MTGGQGLAWAGVMAVLHVAGSAVVGALTQAADRQDQILRITTVHTILVAILAPGIWWMFRRHGNRAWQMALAFIGVGLVLFAGQELVWTGLAEVLSPMALWYLGRGFAFLFPFLVAVALMGAMGWGLKAWMPRLLIAGVAAGLVNVLVGWFLTTYALDWPKVVLLIGPLFVGAIFGVLSGLSMIRSRKVMV